eukprot:6712741-Ditylum_brightwellii.AAC.1
MKEIATIITQKEYDLYAKRKATYKQNKTRMYAVAYGQCSKAMRESSRVPMNMRQQQKPPT